MLSKDTSKRKIETGTSSPTAPCEIKGCRNAANQETEEGKGPSRRIMRVCDWHANNSNETEQIKQVIPTNPRPRSHSNPMGKETQTFCIDSNQDFPSLPQKQSKSLLPLTDNGVTKKNVGDEEVSQKNDQQSETKFGTKESNTKTERNPKRAKIQE